MNCFHIEFITPNYKNFRVKVACSAVLNLLHFSLFGGFCVLPARAVGDIFDKLCR